MSRLSHPFEKSKPDALSLEFIGAGGLAIPIILYGYKWLMRRRRDWKIDDYLDHARQLIAKDRRCLERAREIFDFPATKSGRKT